MSKFIQGDERKAFVSDIGEVMGDLIDDVVRVADKHNVDRDNAMQYFATIFKTMVDVSTFQEWGTTEEG